jgi:acyl carrier protein
MTQLQILSRLRELLADTFEIDPARVTPEADLYRDLDLDSIDAVDLAIKLQEMTGKRIKPDEFRSVRTVNDVMVAVDRLLAA